MKEFNEIIGHDNVISYLEKVIDKDFVANTYIFSGDKGLGKFEVAKIFAQKLLRSSGDNSTDLVILDNEGLSISVDEVRERIVKDTNIKPMQSEYKIYIIKSAQKLTIQAQNALLKVLEESPQYVVVILVVSDESKILSTIKSRSITLKFTSPDVKDVVKYVRRKYDIPEDVAYKFTKLTNANVGRTIIYVEMYLNSDIWNKIIHLLNHFSEIKSYEIISFIKSLNVEERDLFLSTLLCYYRDLLTYKISNDLNTILLKELTDEIMKNVIKTAYKSIYSIIDAITEAISRIDANANMESILEILLYKIKENINDNGSRS